jgi:menaquinone reductase, molybdopterin-binding-like subunit
MKRRDFLKVSALAAGSAALAACGPTISARNVPAQVFIPEARPVDGELWYATTCAICPAACGVVVRTIEGRAKKLEGNPVHPISRGKLCARGQAAIQHLYNPDRIRQPLRRVGDRGTNNFEAVSWDEAINEVASRLGEAAQGAGPGSVLFFSGQNDGHAGLVMDRFARALGGPGRIAFSPTGHTALRQASQAAYGVDALPDYDIDNADVIISFGADFLETWLSPVRYGRGYGFMRQGRPGRRGRLFHVESRMSLTAANADRWFVVNPGTEGALALGIAHLLLAEHEQQLPEENGQVNRGAWRNALGEFSPENVARITGVNEPALRELAETFATGRPSLAIGGGSIEGSTNAVATLTAINALNALVGNVGQEGGVRFAPGLPFADELQVAPASFDDARGHLERMRAGQVNALLLHNTNPAFAFPDPDGVREALMRVPFTVSFSSFVDESTTYADFVLPDNTFFESFNTYVPQGGTNIPVLSIAQPVVNPLYDTRNTADVVIAIARQMGGPAAAALPWDSFENLLQEVATELQALNRGSVTAEDADQMWQRMLQNGGWWDEDPEEEAPAANQQDVAGQLRYEAPNFEGDSATYPMFLHVYESNSFGDGVGANLPLLQELPDPMTTVVWGSWVEINPHTMEEMGLNEGDLVTITSPRGQVDVPVYRFPAIAPNVVAMPLGQGHSEYGQWARQRGVNPMRIVAPVVQPQTGGLAFSATRVNVARAPGRGRLITLEGESHRLPETTFLDVGHGFFGTEELAR